MSEVLHIVMAMKPTQGNFVENALLHGVVGLNIDGCRIEGIKNIPASPRRAPQNAAYGDLSNDPGTGSGWNPAIGRWPANIILGHAEGCVLKGTKKVKPNEGNRVNPVGKQSDGKIQFSLKPEGYQKVSYTDDDGMERTEDWECVGSCPVKMLGDQSGILKSGDLRGETVKADNRIYNTAGDTLNRKLMVRDGDSGGADRFFKQIAELQVDE